MPQFYAKAFCEDVAANPPALGTRVATMAASWVRQLRWARSQIPAETLANADVVKIVTYPEWQFRAVSGTQPLGQADVAEIRKRIQAELASLGADTLPVYANFLVVAGSFYYGGMVDRKYKKQPVDRVENFTECGTQEPKIFIDNKKVFFTGRRPWVEKSIGGTYKRSWAMFNCVDTYFVPADGSNGLSARLIGPAIRCKAFQSELARQVHPFREVWGRCAVTYAAKHNYDVLDVFGVPAKKKHAKALRKFDAAYKKLEDAVTALNDKSSAERRTNFDYSAQRNALFREMDDLSRVWESARWPEVKDFASTTLFFSTFRIAIDICADYGLHFEHATMEKTNPELLPGGSAGRSRADLYFIISNGKDLEEDRKHVSQGGYVLRTDGQGLQFVAQSSNMYHLPRMAGSPKADKFLPVSDGKIIVDSAQLQQLSLSEDQIRTKLLAQQLDWGYFWLGDYTIPSHQLPSLAEKNYKEARDRMIEAARKAGVDVLFKRAKLVAFLASARAVVLEENKKWGRSALGKFFRSAKANEKNLKLRQLLIYKRPHKAEFFLHLRDSANPTVITAWKLPIVGDFSNSMLQTVNAQAIPCLGAANEESFLNMHPDSSEINLKPWVKDGCGKRQPCICIALDHTDFYGVQSNTAALTVFDSAKKRKQVLSMEPRIMRAVIGNQVGAADFLHVLRYITLEADRRDYSKSNPD